MYIYIYITNFITNSCMTEHAIRPDLSEQDDWKKKKRNINIAPVVGSIPIILLTVVAVLWGLERKRQHGKDFFSCFLLHFWDK